MLIQTNSKEPLIYLNLLLLQYDVELYQRIEQLIGKQLPLYKTEESEVMVLQERVAEAQRLTKIVSTFWKLTIIEITSRIFGNFTFSWYITNLLSEERSIFGQPWTRQFTWC